MRKFFLLLLTALSFSFVSSGKGIGAFLSHSTFNIPGQSPYVEVYLEIIGNTLVYDQLPSGKFQGKVQVTMVVRQDSVIKDYKKYELLSAELADTSGVGVNFIDQQRFSLPNGNYTLELAISDMHVNKEPSTLLYPIEVVFPEKEYSISTIQLINSYTKSTSASALTKSGYDLVPMVDNFFRSDRNKLIFYSEIYNPLHKEGSEEKYLVSYYIESFESGRILNDYAIAKRESSKPVMVVLNEFDISKLPSGNYNVVVILKNKDNSTLASSSSFFERSNPVMDNNAMNYSMVDLSNSFAIEITSADTLREFIRSLNPIATQVEKMFINYQLATADVHSMQQYFQKFWEDREPLNPRKAWQVYKVQVKKVNEAYSTRVKKGYDTDMGYVFLKYGQPDAVMDIPFEASTLLGESAIPYQIWQYYSILNGTQRNKRFVFVSSELQTKDYTLVHSDVKGELQNYNWQHNLKRLPGGFGLDPEQDRGSRASTRYQDPF